MSYLSFLKSLMLVTKIKNRMKIAMMLITVTAYLLLEAQTLNFQTIRASKKYVLFSN